MTNKQVCNNSGPPIYQFKKCFKIGHRTSWCKSNQLCATCSQSYHRIKCNKNKFCVLCKKECGHIALQFQCPTRKLYVKNKSIKIQGYSKPASNDNGRSRSRSKTTLMAGPNRRKRSFSTKDRQIKNQNKKESTL